MNTEDLLIETAEETKERLATQQAAQTNEQTANLAVPSAAAFSEAITKKLALDQDDILIPAAEIAAIVPATP